MISVKRKIFREKPLLPHDKDAVRSQKWATLDVAWADHFMTTQSEILAQYDILECCMCEIPSTMINLTRVLFASDASLTCTTCLPLQRGIDFLQHMLSQKSTYFTKRVS
jgi:hypothetical protein